MGGGPHGGESDLPGPDEDSSFGIPPFVLLGLLSAGKALYETAIDTHTSRSQFSNKVLYWILFQRFLGTHVLTLHYTSNILGTLGKVYENPIQ